MHEAYKLIIVNTICVGVLLLGALTYYYIYPKKKINLFILLILISIIPIISNFRPGDYQSGDFNIHLTRIMTFYDSLQEGNIMPSWSGELNATYGNPLFLLNYPLPYYFVSLLHFVGFSFVTSLKLFLASTFVFSGIFMFIAMKKIVKNDLAAFVTAIFYLFNPYHLSDIHFRATLGESTIYMIFPLLLYYVTCFLYEKKIKFLILVSLITILLSLAHPMVSLPIFGIIAIFVVTLNGIKGRIKSLLYVFAAIVLGFIASLYVWVPFLLFSNIMFPDPSSVKLYQPLYELFYSPYFYGFLFQGPQGELPFPLGYPQEFAVLLGLVLLLKTNIYKKFKQQYAMWFIILAILIFFYTPVSNFIWVHFKMIWMLVDRLPLPMAICTTMIAGYIAFFFSKSKKYTVFMYLVVFATVCSTILNWGQRTVIANIGDVQLREGVPLSTAAFGSVPFLRTKFEDKNLIATVPKNHLEVINGKAQLKELSRTSTNHIYLVNANSPLTIQENTLWYPGWTLKSNNKLVPIFPGKAGIIHAKLPPGLQFVELTFTDVPIMILLKNLSIGIIVLLLLLLAFSFYPSSKNILNKQI